ncbi:MAG: mannose-1-phosphate guanylyltransferase [bacterium]|nr:mannose-1-phosphate guanylyltransferase [bacterium]
MLYAVIMAGGSGTRFWPASRAAKPKQFLAVHSDRSLLTETADRLTGLVPSERILVVGSADHVELVHEALPDLPRENLLCEPVGRNTLPCVALASAELERRDPHSTQIVLPADHVIEPLEAFQTTLRAAVSVAEDSRALVTLGIRPTHAATGYGYIEAGGSIGEALGSEIFEVRRFVEKPSAERAAEFASAGNFLWNAGVFVWTTAAIRAALAEHAGELLAALDAAGPDDLQRVYADLDSVPVDVGIMEKASNVRVLPVGYAWSDIGSWSALPDVLAADDNGNVVAGSGTLVDHDAHGNVVYAEKGHITALVGVDDLIVVHAGGATLVCRKDRAQDVRRIVEQLRTMRPEDV